ncbi:MULTISPECIES: phosphotransferase [unclassified Roseovarius]|uniref:phosphotransferase n=1 Tax=unclassified Roseovarius TaxID=2614913 RepID=UPI00273DFB7D|nr:phosphotransferase [Roseovarius sp. MMSF_3350]
MTSFSTSDAAPSADPDLSGLVARRLEEAAAEDAAFSTAQATELIREVAGKRVVLRGRIGEQPAVFRLYLDRVEDCARDWNELCRIWPKMREGELRVCAPLGYAPEAGIMAVSEVEGTPLLQWIYGAPEAERARYLEPAARWLRAYTECTETDAAAQPAGWAKRAERAAKTQAFNRLKRVEKPILKEILRLVPLLEDGQWRFAVSHGDFHPNNLIVNGNMVTGIDCGGSRPAPVYKDMARFLMHMGRRAMIPSGEVYLGVDRQGFIAFCDAFQLSAHEREVTLPFFIAVEALLRAETRNLPQSRVRRARQMSEALLTDLERIGR